MKDVFNKLDLDQFKTSSINKVWIEIIRSALSEPISVPVIVIKGSKPGPIFGITAALHGNEVNGVGVIHKFIEKINPKSLSGTLVCVLVSNVPGYLKKVRSFSDRIDLNHIMPGKKHGNTAEVYAYNLFNKVIKKFDYLVDLHTASKGRYNTLYIRADMNDKRVSRMAILLRPEIILHNPPNDKTMRGAASKIGIPSVTVEVGNPFKFQEKYIRKTVVGLKALLVHAKILKTTLPIPSPQKMYKCKSSKWIYTDNGGVLDVSVELGQKIRRGEKIASIKNIFGEVVSEYFCQNDGIVIGKSVDPVAETGSRILHLGFRDGK